MSRSLLDATATAAAACRARQRALAAAGRPAQRLRAARVRRLRAAARRLPRQTAARTRSRRATLTRRATRSARRSLSTPTARKSACARPSGLVRRRAAAFRGGRSHSRSAVASQQWCVSLYLLVLDAFSLCVSLSLTFIHTSLSTSLALDHRVCARVREHAQGESRGRRHEPRPSARV